MKILITDIHNGNGGGHVTYVLNLLKGGLNQHFDVTVAAPQTGRLYRYASTLTDVRVVPRRFPSSPLALLRAAWALRRFLRQEDFDVVHVNGSADHRQVMLARLGLRRKPAVVWTKHNTKPVRSLGNWLRAVAGTQATIAVCEHVAKMLAKSRYRHRPIRVIRLGVDTAYFQPVDEATRQACRQSLFGDLDPDVIVLGSVAGTDHAKGWHVLAQALAALAPHERRRFRMVVAGDPPSPGQQALVGRLGMSQSILFPGLLADVRPLLAACDVGFVLSFAEAGSYASCETMAMGLPTLVSNVGGLPENVRDGVDGWVVPADDAPALIRVLRSLLDGNCDLAAMGGSARQRIEQGYSLRRFFDDTVRTYRQARGGAAGAASIAGNKAGLR